MGVSLDRPLPLRWKLICTLGGMLFGGWLVMAHRPPSDALYTEAPGGSRTFEGQEFRAIPGLEDKRMASHEFDRAVSLAEAREICAAWSQRLPGTFRLPSGVEWERAARGGRRGFPYPWGHASPEGRANFRAEAPSLPGTYPPNRFGLFDLVGRRWEWCSDGRARGGSWAERDPAMLRLEHAQEFPAGYIGEDVSFRMLWVPD